MPLSTNRQSSLLPSEEWIEIGRIGRPHGVSGGLHLTLYNDDGDLLTEGLVLQIGRSKDAGVQRRQVTVTSVYGPTLVKLDGVVGRENAAALTGQTLWAKREDFPEPDDDEAYLVDLIGLQVTSPQGNVLGEVEAFSDNGAQPLLQLRRPSQGPLVEVPLVAAFIVTLDVEAGQFVMDLPEGLVEGEAAVAGTQDAHQPQETTAAPSADRPLNARQRRALRRKAGK